MSPIEKYNNCFIEAFDLDDEDVTTFVYKESEGWDSVGHMNLIALIEDKFDIMLETDDIIGFNSYEKGLSILKDNYGIDLSWGND